VRPQAPTFGRAGAVDAGLIRANPCRLRGAGTEHADGMRVATPDEVQALVEVVDDRWKALVLTAAYAGLRWGEMTGLRRRDISPDGTTITVSVQLSEIKNKIELDAPPKTAAGKRTVTLPDVVAGILVGHLDRFTGRESSALVFTSPEGEPLRRNNFRRPVWYPAVTKVGLEGLRVPRPEAHRRHPRRRHRRSPAGDHGPTRPRGPCRHAALPARHRQPGRRHRRRPRPPRSTSPRR